MEMKAHTRNNMEYQQKAAMFSLYIARHSECVALLNELDAPVEYIVLPTFAYEHKIFVGPFSRRFPTAQVWVAPRYGGRGESICRLCVDVRPVDFFLWRSFCATVPCMRLCIASCLLCLLCMMCVLSI